MRSLCSIVGFLVLETGCALFGGPPKVERYSDDSARSSSPPPSAPPANTPPAESSPAIAEASTPPSAPVVVSADPTAVAAQLRQACDAGQQQGCVGLAMLYWRGMGVAEDKDQAQALLQKACDSGEALGCAMRDRLLHAGEAPGASPVGAVAIDPQTVSTLEAACTSGNQDACVGVGTLYWRGMGVAEDHEKARALLDHACQSGNANGCTALRLLTAKP